MCECRGVSRHSPGIKKKSFDFSGNVRMTNKMYKCVNEISEIPFFHDNFTPFHSFDEVPGGLDQKTARHLQGGRQS